MTDEELVEISWQSKSLSYKVNNAERTYEDGFLNGLKAGRPKWHKVADGDYPPCKRGNYTITVLTNFGNIAYYDYDLDCWIARSSSTEIDPPIAWCEIPTFTDKE